jgi:hypothetical protein
MDKKYLPKFESQTLLTIVSRLESGHNHRIFDLPYQRDIVWSHTRMQNFLDSLLNGTIPKSILINIDQNGNYLCMDGKQRLTSLLLFMQNKIPISEVKQYNGGHMRVYYSALPTNDTIDSKSRTMTPLERDKFNAISIPVATYLNLSYSEQVDVFQQLQPTLLPSFAIN